MNLQAIKDKLETLNQGNQSRPDFTDKFWKPKMGKNTIRVVPSAYNPDMPFSELKFHNKLSTFPILALTNFGKQDPVEEFRQKLREKGGKDNWSLHGKLTPNVRYFVPVIVRGEEEQGVRLWSIGVTMYKAMLRLAADEEIGDYTDVVNGIDMTVEKTEGDPYPETTVTLKRKNSPLSDDPEKVKEWTTNQPKPEECFTQRDYAFIKDRLEAYLKGTSGTPAATTEQPVTEETKTVEEPTPEQPKPQAPAPKKTTVSKFNDLFEDGDDEEDEDVKSGKDLPF